ncbi:MAG: hypothetical protein IPP63_18885 [Chloracidobacterium sp.]|nr:hypothetical protein [Chloracidobacterium sp.]
MARKVLSRLRRSPSRSTVPLIYNGMEVGDTAELGAPALFEKLPIFWQFAERRPEFPRFYKAMTSLRKKQRRPSSRRC